MSDIEGSEPDRRLAHRLPVDDERTIFRVSPQFKDAKSVVAWLKEWEIQISTGFDCLGSRIAKSIRTSNCPVRPTVTQASS